MARFMRLDVCNELSRIGLLPLFSHDDLDTAAEIVAALARGGARLVEFTNRGDDAYAVFTGLVRRFARAEPQVILGVGSIVDAPTAALYIAAGAQFIVGPNLNPEIARLCNRRKLLYIPGCATASEIATAEELGAEFCKLFPAEALGPSFIRALLGPCPWHRLVPTGGVEATEASVRAWIQAGATAVGMGTKLIRPLDIAGRDFDGISRQTAHVIGWIRAARGAAIETNIHRSLQ